MPDPTKLSDSDTLDEIILIAEELVGLVNDFEPMAKAVPAVGALMARIDALKQARQLP